MSNFGPGLSLSLLNGVSHFKSKHPAKVQARLEAMSSSICCEPEVRISNEFIFLYEDILPTVRFEVQISSVESKSSTNCATTTASRVGGLKIMRFIIKLMHLRRDCK